MIEVVIADDQALVRDGLRLILDSQEDITVVAEAADGTEAIAAAREYEPDVVLMDIRMPGVDGLQATRDVTARGSARVVVLTTFDLDDYVVEALRSGASGFLLKSSPRQHLFHAVRTAADGGALIDPLLTRRLLDEHLAPAMVTPAAYERQLQRLSTRERQTLDLLAQGLSNTAIAERLFLGETTVKSHVASTLRKLELSDRIQAVIFAYEAGIVRPGQQT